ncbi:hypothetical protein FF011L_12260 [Roseimaritima multifibrata]|uniref:DUF6876 domain-containing protein n=1 Tax=Roseimaritima multifibrata TaxID=1930274 RepID=A0A517MC71_9BACT|nr:DUF6876 family protein [Roseimaritima multifibrata]QDS92483.1 hypothetical protein FF011L_12260 [Roseimaritima multifibrata]
MTQLTYSQLQHFTGDLERYRHSFNRRVIYTLGVQHVAERGEAYWLIDAIASWIGSKSFRQAALKDSRIEEMHFWTLQRTEGTAATLFAKADSPDAPFITQEIEFTDFPLPKIDIWAAFDGEHWTLYLPSEH